jgi:hypothetical protein
MLTKDFTVDARRRELEKAYEEALRYSMSYRTGWSDLESAATRLRAFHEEQSAAARAA